MLYNLSNVLPTQDAVSHSNIFQTALISHLVLFRIIGLHGVLEHREKKKKSFQYSMLKLTLLQLLKMLEQLLLPKRKEAQTGEII